MSEISVQVRTRLLDGLTSTRRQRAGRQPSVITMSEKLEIVAAGTAIAFPRGSPANHRCEDTVWVPLDDVTASVVALAWPSRRIPRLEVDFIVNAGPHRAT